ncbi:type II secretory pathway pseudopilin PulG [Streptomyces sp. B3I7]|uniref:hypothetical protein n=1 Tax=Streptomyces sp. B3I7 TaxID=3042269 RepID=UPI00278560C0|nr:hypothetical protein [Streptomyces sp. B3I7]MDQ0811284.1 type II secretory pathway pseudopilin PulG [Streptomyces sp. B3I7]
MDTTHAQALVGMLAVLGLLALITLPALIGVVHDRRVDRQIRAAREQREGEGSGQKSSSKPTEPSTATWYADARRSKKLVNS